MSEPVQEGHLTGRAAPVSVYALLADGRNGGDQAGHPGRLHCGQGHARGDVAGQRLPALLQPQQARGRAGGAAGHQGTRTRPRRPARAVRRPGRRARQLRGGAGQCDKRIDRTAEVAFAVADTMHHRGIATLLLEHLVSLARARQLEALTARDAAGEHRTCSGSSPTLACPSSASARTAWSLSRSRCRLTTLAASLRSTWTRSRYASGPPTWPASGRCSRPAPSRSSGRAGEPGGSAGRSWTTSRPAGTRGSCTRSTRTQGRSAASRASPTSIACRRRPTSRYSPSRRWRSWTPRRRAVSAGCAGSWYLPRPSTRRSAPTCSPPAAGTGCG